MSDLAILPEVLGIDSDVPLSTPSPPSVQAVLDDNLRHSDNSNNNDPRNQHQHHHHHHPKVIRSLKLISVSFKELALDSPTFRAYVNHSFNQIEAFKIWIEGLLILKRDYESQHSMFKDSMLQLRGLFESTALTDGLIDSDYVALDLNFTAAGFKEIQHELFKFTKPNVDIDKLTNDLIQDGIIEFTNTRRKFETIQNMYDLVLSRYCSLSKSRDPITLREDNFQLAEIRKQYIELSLETSMAITDLTRSINSYIIDVVTLIWRTNLDLKIHTKNYTSFNKYVERIYKFQQESMTSMEGLRDNLLKSKLQTVETTLLQHLPSKELNDYNSALINPSTMLDNFHDKAEEKHGWLFMKTTVGKPLRQVWVRRWCFMKDGIIGLSSLSPTKTFVQELDKLGIAVCNIRYCPEEDRRYCFELKTISNIVVLQAETLLQLKSWLKVFHSVKAKALESGLEIGFNRYPPVLRDFACTATTSTDTELTSSEQSPNLSDLVQKSSLTIDGGLLSTICNAPISTLYSKEAIAGHGIASPTTIPNALTANIWGSVNWGSYYLLNKPLTDVAASSASQLLNDKSLFHRYPSYYPKRLILYDCQLRSLLGARFPENEFVLIEFRGIWLPNSKQELVGRCYVTQNFIFFYMNSLGFVSLLLLPFSEILSFQSVTEDDYDTLKISEVSGLSMKLKLYLDSGRLIKDQMTVVLESRMGDEPKPLSAVLKELENLRSVHAKQEIERLRTNFEAKKEIIPSVVSTSLKHQLPMEMKTNYNKEMKLIWDKVYDIPSKLLFHLLIGDDSFILQKILPFIDARNENISMTLWNQNSKQQLKRTFMTDTVLDTNDFRTTRINQTIESLINSKYYNILQKTQYFKFPGMNAYRIITRVIIYSLNLKNSKLLVYSKVQFDERERFQMKILNFPNAHFLTKISRLKVEKLDHEIREAIDKIGPHAKVVKLIRLYGQITKNEVAEPVPENDDVLVVDFLAFLKVILKKIFREIFGVVWFFVSLIFQFFKSLRLNYILVLLLGLSFGYNLIMSGKSTMSYWVVSSAEKTIGRYTNENVMSRAIFLKDVEELVDFKYGGTESRCFDNFKHNSFVLNHNSSVDNDLKRTFRNLGLKRNKLLIDLKIINDLEKHLVDVEWNNFLTNELHRCDLISEFPIDADEIHELKQYCSSCRMDFEQIADQLENLVDDARFLHS